MASTWRAACGGVLVLGMLSCIVWVWEPWAPPAVPSSRSVEPVDEQVNLLLLGDWGDASRAQKAVADEMANCARHLDRRCDAVLMLGDNFYKPVTGVDDPAWQSTFEQMYRSDWLAMPFYALLGNHDYKNDQDTIQLEYARQHGQSRFKMPSRWYRLDLPARDPIVTVLMLDSNFAELGPEQWNQQSRWLADELTKPRLAPWLVAAAHHPLYSDGRYGDNARLQKDWLPLFDHAGLDFYVCGHDHNLQHLEIPGHSFSSLISGGGGAAETHDISRCDRGPFAVERHGFHRLRLGRHSADADIIDSRGRVIHSFSKAARPAEAVETRRAALHP